MRSVLNWISGIILVTAIGFSLITLGNGKLVTVFGEEIFMAAPSDIKAAFVLLLAAAPATIWILFSLYERGQKLDVRDQKLVEWQEWVRANQGRTIQ